MLSLVLSGSEAHAAPLSSWGGGVKRGGWRACIALHQSEGTVAWAHFEWLCGWAGSTQRYWAAAPPFPNPLLTILLPCYCLSSHCTDFFVCARHLRKTCLSRESLQHQLPPTIVQCLSFISSQQTAETLTAMNCKGDSKSLMGWVLTHWSPLAIHLVLLGISPSTSTMKATRTTMKR